MKIKDLPDDIKKLALLRQVEQGNPENGDVCLTIAAQGGFIWERTLEGLEAWREADDGNYQPIRDFHAKEPKQEEGNGKDTLARLIAGRYPNPGNWPEDFEHENGNYENICAKCEEKFMGYKHRMVCKACFTTAAAKYLPATPYQEQEKNPPAPAPFTPKTGDEVMVESTNGIGKLKRIFLFTHQSGAHYCLVKSSYDYIFRTMEPVHAIPYNNIYPVPIFTLSLTEAREEIAKSRGCKVEGVIIKV